MNPLVSIIIPTYNRAHLIGETLDSITAQTYTNWECIIVDDESTDNTDEFIKSYVEKDSRFQYYKRPSNKIKGPNSCRNYGFQLCKGDYINWFDSDDLYFSDSLETFIRYFKDEADVVIAKVEKIDSATKIKIGENRILSNAIIEDYFVGLITFYVCGPLWKRSFIKKQTELFDEVIMNLDDWDFNLRMLYQKPRIIYINKPLIKYRIHENSLSKEIEKLNFNELKSEFLAREKQLKLIQVNNSADVFILRKFIKDRYKYILRTALVQNHNKKTYFFKKLLVKQLSVFDFKGIFNTLFGFIVFSVFNKGYKYFK